MELSLYRLFHSQSNQSGIETATISLVDPNWPPLNRTKAELKRHVIASPHNLIFSLNRTKAELKHRNCIVWHSIFGALNRTKAELKLEKRYDVLIRVTGSQSNQSGIETWQNPTPIIILFSLSIEPKRNWNLSEIFIVKLCGISQSNQSGIETRQDIDRILKHKPSQSNQSGIETFLFIKNSV